MKSSIKSITMLIIWGLVILCSFYIDFLLFKLTKGWDRSTVWLATMIMIVTRYRFCFLDKENGAEYTSVFRCLILGAIADGLFIVVGTCLISNIYTCISRVLAYIGIRFLFHIIAAMYVVVACRAVVTALPHIWVYMLVNGFYNHYLEERIIRSYSIHGAENRKKINGLLQEIINVPLNGNLLPMSELKDKSIMINTNDPNGFEITTEYLKYLDNNEAYEYYQALFRRWADKYGGKDINEIINNMYQVEYFGIIRGYDKVFNDIEALLEYRTNNKSGISKELFYSARKKYNQFIAIYLNYIEERAVLLQDTSTRLTLGKRGEDLIDNYLSLYKGLFYDLKNYRVEFEGQRVENDHIIISPNGVFVVEVKNYGESGNFDIKIEKDGRWSRIYKDGRINIFEENPTKQNDRHIVYLQRLINSELGRNMAEGIEVKGIIAIGNNIVNIQNESLQNIVRAEGIYSIISSYSKILSIDEMDAIYMALEKYQVPIQKYPRVDIENELLYNISIFKNHVSVCNNMLKSIQGHLNECWNYLS